MDEITKRDLQICFDTCDEIVFKTKNGKEYIIDTVRKEGKLLWALWDGEPIFYGETNEDVFDNALIDGKHIEEIIQEII